MDKLKIEYVRTADLRPRPGNPRTHNKKQLGQLAKSLTAYGFVNPALIDSENCIIAGHGRVEAAKLIGLSEVPTVRISDLTEPQIRAYVIADNQLATLSGWDDNLMCAEFAYLATLEEFDITLTGFEIPQIDAYLYPSATLEKKSNKDDIVPPVPEGAVTQVGYVWQIGRHRLICASATSSETYPVLLEDKKAIVIFSDPPYNVKIKGHVSGLGKAQHREFKQASGG